MNCLAMTAVEKKIKKEVKNEVKAQRKNHRGQEQESSGADAAPIEPPRLHRDMRVLCDALRVSDRTRHALRCFDAANLEDFGLMTDEDYADMVVTQARIGDPLPPLQQRKVRVLLSWAQAFAKGSEEGEYPMEMEGEVANDAPDNAAEGFELKESKTGGDVMRAKYRASARKPPKPVKVDWEGKFYDDLPRLKRELREMGRNAGSNWASEFLCLRWIVCG